MHFRLEVDESRMPEKWLFFLWHLLIGCSKVFLGVRILVAVIFEHYSRFFFLNVMFIFTLITTKIVECIQMHTNSNVSFLNWAT